jgi:hypothetical protein
MYGNYKNDSSVTVKTHLSAVGYGSFVSLPTIPSTFLAIRTSLKQCFCVDTIQMCLFPS